MPQQRLSNRGLVRDNVAVGVAVPRTQNGIGFVAVRLHVAHGDDCANGNA